MEDMMSEAPAIPDHDKRGHSPLGASGAERWMNCPGSVALLRELTLPESDEPDYRREGTAMHEASEHCLRNGLDTWEIVGEEFNETKIDPPMADAIQMYLDACRRDIQVAAYHYIELPVSSPVHPDFYGSLDFAAVIGQPSFDDPHFIVPELVVVRDLKGGQGIVVDPEDNPQLKYYAYGLIDKNPHWADETPVRLEIAQPRAWHLEGPIRHWETTVGEIREWVHDTLVPAMARTEMDGSLDAGPWCRFCPAKLVCPLLTSLFRAACNANIKEIVNVSDDSLGRSYRYAQAVRFYLKALEEETLRRAMKGVEFQGVAKLVQKKANRVFSEAGAELAKQKFGKDAFTEPQLKSPPEIEKLGPAAKEFVKEFAYMPNTGFTLATWDDPKPAVKVQTSNEAFAAAVAATEGAA